MYDGSLRKVQDIKVGDQVIGPDGLPRNVKDTIRGRSNLYKIRQKSGEDYIVNEDHIISLKKSKSSKRDKGELSSLGNYRRPNGRYSNYPDIVNISIKDWQVKSKRWKDNFYGYKASCVKFKRKDLFIEPYFLGLWLGDGDKNLPIITTADQEVVDYLNDFVKQYPKGRVSIYDYQEGNRAKRYALCSKIGKENPITQCLKPVLNNKHIPQEFLTSSEEQRLELLAGLIDSDGSVKNNCYVFSQKDFSLIRQVKQLADFLGFKTNLREQTTTCNNKSFLSYKLTISGNAHRIPCKVNRKKIIKASPNKDFLRTAIDIESIGVGDYAGISIDGDHLFLLGDGTVTHNSHNVARTLIVMGMEKPLRIVCAREIQKSIKDSVHALLADIIRSHGLDSFYEIQESIIKGANGTEFKFRGLKHNTTDMKSLEGIDICWIEEAENVSNNSYEILIPTIRKEGSEIWVTFNPKNVTDPTYQRFVGSPHPDSRY
jgi:replicative DNA helicase